jgi:hypothetical protein
MTVPKTPGGAAMFASTYQVPFTMCRGTRTAPDMGSPCSRKID